MALALPRRRAGGRCAARKDASDGDAYRCHYKRLTLQSPSGGQCEEEVKAWYYIKRVVAWEVRRLVKCLGYRGRLLDEPATFLSRTGQLFEKCGWGDFNLDEHVMPPRKALAARDEQAEHFCPVREEFQLSTEGFVATLLVLHRGRRGEGRVRVRSLGRAWLQAFCDEVPDMMLDPRLSDEEYGLCGLPTEEVNVCPRWEMVLRSEPQGNSPLDSAFLQLLVASEQGCLCKACQAWAKRACRELAKLIDKKVPEAESETNPLNMQDHLMGRSGKKRRYDEDYKLAVAREVVEKKSALTPSAFARASDNLVVRTAASWEHGSMSWYQAASWAAFGNAENVSITMDASRVGQPALDLMFYAMESVIPDFQEEDASLQPKAGDPEKKAGVGWQLKLAAFTTEEKEVENAAREALRTLSGAGARRSNRCYGLALDRALQMGADLSLSTIYVKDPPKPLAADEGRYYTDEVVLGDGSVERRACIEDKSSGACRFELPRLLVDNRIVRKSMHVHIDSGAVGLPFCVWLFTCGNCRGTFTPDWVHMCHNRAKLAERSSEIWWMLLETMVAFNFPTGPFNMQAHFSVFKAAFMAYWRQNTWECPVFAMFYEGVCRDSGKPLPANYGTAEHMEAVWKSLPSWTCFVSKGVRIRMSRWWSWHDRQGEVQHVWHTYALGLVVVGLERGWWKSVWESPMERQNTAAPVNEGNEAAEQPAPGGDGAGEEPRSVAAAAEQLEMKRQETANNMHFLCKVFANEYIRRLARCTYHILTPMRKIGEDEVAAKTIDGTYEIAMTNVTRMWNATLVDISQVMFNPEVLSDLNFGTNPDDPNELADDNTLAEKMYWLTVNLLGAYLSWLPLRSDALPRLLNALLHTSASVRQSALERLQRLWHLVNLYASRRDEEHVQSLLEGMLWPSMPWFREVLLELDEAKFLTVPRRLQEALSEFCRGWSNTHLSEQVFQHLRGHESRGDTAGRLGPKKAWSAASASGLLDEWGRRQVQVALAHRSFSCRQNFPQSAFIPSIGDLSLDAELFADLSNDQWSSPGPTKYPYAIYCTLAMEACGEDTGKLAQCWQSLLFVKGSSVKHATRSLYYIVLESFTCGAFLWQVKMQQRGEHHLVDFKPVDGSKPWVFEQCCNHSDWKAVSLKGRPPSWLIKNVPAFSKGRPAKRLMLAASGRALSLLRFAATRAFPGLTMPYLTKVAHMVGVERPARTEKPLLKELIAKVCPDLSEATIDACLKDRRRTSAPRDADQCSVLAEDMKLFEQAQGLIDECDRKDFKEAVEKLATARSGKVQKEAQRKKVDEKPAVAAPSAASASSSSSASGPGPRTNVKRTIALGLSSEVDVQHLKPPVKGCTLTKDDRRFMRWSASYPKESPPRLRSKVWTLPGWTEKRGLLYGLQWLWLCHREATGEECPWDLEDFALPPVA